MSTDLQAQAVPWYHFIPSLYDYSDLFDIMAFFTGSPDGTVPGRDDLAEEIGRNGQAFAMEKLRWEDMRSYMFLLLLEVTLLSYQVLMDSIDELGRTIVVRQRSKDESKGFRGNLAGIESTVHVVNHNMRTIDHP